MTRTLPLSEVKIKFSRLVADVLRRDDRAAGERGERREHVADVRAFPRDRDARLLRTR